MLPLNHPRPLAHKITEELEAHPFPDAIARLNGEQAAHLDIHSTYRGLLETANSLPGVLETRISDLRARIELELQTQTELVALVERQRRDAADALARLQAEYDAAQAGLEAERARTRAKWREIAEREAELRDLHANDGLAPAHRGTQQSLDLLSQLPVGRGTRAARELSTDELWDRMAAVVAQQDAPALPIHTLFPSVQQFLTS